MVATDGGGLSDTASVTVIVQRNLQNPVFAPTTYTATIIENYALATPVIRVTATDADVLVDISVRLDIYIYIYRDMI